jgi:hypothetical protein
MRDTKMLIRITPENVTDFPVGTKLLTDCGAYYAPVEGVVVDHMIIPASKYFPANAQLIVEQEQDGEIVTNVVTQILDDMKNDRGIGTYLIERAAPQEKVTDSPWSN